MQLKLPVQGVVDRSMLLDIYLVATPVIDATGKTVEILKNPVGGPYGALPGDPCRFRESVNPHFGVCHVLSGYAVAPCLLGSTS